MRIPSSAVGRNCHKESLPVIYGRALEYVPKNPSRTYTFRVLRLVPIKTADSPDSTYSLHYSLEDTEDTVQALNTSGAFVFSGNKVILVLTPTGHYEVYCDCSTKQYAVVIEPSLGMIYPSVPPNFTQCSPDGYQYTTQEVLHSVSCRNGLCVGTLAILDKEYFPVHARYFGGEEYISESGEISYRTIGEKKYTKQGEPLYYMGRSLFADETTGYVKQRNYSNVSLLSAQAVPVLQTYTNSPYQYRYVDGTECGFSPLPLIGTNIPVQGWKSTHYAEMAQYNFELFLCPKQADNEPLPAGSLVQVIQATMVENYVPQCDASGTVIIENGSPIEPVPVAIPYYLVEPAQDTYFGHVNGQQLCYGVLYTVGEKDLRTSLYFENDNLTLPEEIIDVQGNGRIVKREGTNIPINDYFEEIQSKCSIDDNANLFVRGYMKNGRPYLASNDYVLNKSEYQPCRASFTIIGSDLLRYPALCAMICEKGYGVLCTAHPPYDTTQELPVVFQIERRLSVPEIQKYDLFLVPYELYKSEGQLTSYWRHMPEMQLIHIRS